MAFQALQVIIVNSTDSELVFRSNTINDGEWNPSPPFHISPRGTVMFYAETSSSNMTKVDGDLAYYIRGVGNFRFGFDVPYTSDNEYTQSAPRGYKVTNNAKEGSITEITWTVAKI